MGRAKYTNTFPSWLARDIITAQGHIPNRQKHSRGLWVEAVCPESQTEQPRGPHLTCRLEVSPPLPWFDKLIDF